MAFITADRVKETSTTTGTSNFTLAGAVTGFQAFSSVCANNDIVWYCIAHQAATEWEVGLGTWQTGGTLVRADGNVLAGSAGAGARVTFSAGTKDVFITIPAKRRRKTIGITIDGGGAVITTGQKGYAPGVAFTGTIIKAELIADQTGSCVIDVWRVNDAIPTVANTITAAAKPTLSTAQRYEDETLTGWLRDVTYGDVYGFNVDSASTITRVTLLLTVEV